MAEPRTCPRHPDVETRLSCSSCGETICPSCGREAAVGYKCPDCVRHDSATTQPRAGERESPFARLLERFSRDDEEPAPPPPEPAATEPGRQVPMALAARATVVGVVAAVAGGLLIGPVLAQGAFFLISAGVLGWVVARAVYWVTEDRDSTFVRAVAMSVAFLTVLVGHLTAASGPDTVRELALLAYPAALYGGWIVVRQR